MARDLCTARARARLRASPPIRVRRAAALLAAALAGCAEEELLRGLDDAQANQVVVALSEAGVRARPARGEGTDGSLSVTVPADDAARARRVLSAQELPRSRGPGFAEVFGRPGLVPTPVEERARYLLALQGELGRTLETLDGVVAARVHLALPTPDPLHPEPPRPPRAAVLLRSRPGARERVEALAPGVRQLVAGAAEGLEASAVAVVVADGPADPGPPAARRPPARLWLGLGAGALAAAAGGVALAAARGPRRRSP